MTLRPRRHLLRALLAAVLGLTAALPVSCGSSGRGLIPAANAGPLQSDFEAVAQAAEGGNGDCSSTEAALAKTERDFAALPATIDAGLRNTLRQGISNLRARAIVLCSQPLVQTNTTPTVTTPTATTPTVTQTTPTTTTPATTTPSTPSGSHGGTAAPGEEGEEKPGKGPKKEKEHGGDHGGAGGAEAGEEEAGGAGK